MIKSTQKNVVSNKNEESIDVGTDEEEETQSAHQLPNTDEDTKSSEDHSPLVPKESNIQSGNNNQNSTTTMYQN